MVWSDEVEGKRELMFGVMTVFYLLFVVVVVVFLVFCFFQNALLYNT